MGNFLTWSELNHLQLNVTKPKELMEAVYKKGQSRLFFLRRLRSFNICRMMLRMFYESVVASVIFFTVTCWGSGLKVADNNRLRKLIEWAGDVVGEELDTLMTMAERRMLSKLQPSR